MRAGGGGGGGRRPWRPEAGHRCIAEWVDQDEWVVAVVIIVYFHACHYVKKPRHSATVCIDARARVRVGVRRGLSLPRG